MLRKMKQADAVASRPVVGLFRLARVPVERVRRLGYPCVFAITRSASSI